MIRVKPFLIALIVFGKSAVALACGNEYGRQQALPLDNSGKLILESTLKGPDLTRALQRNVSYQLLSDHAWNELRAGNKNNAVKLLEKLYAKYPDEYNIVANPGTAYEVIGKDAKALELLKKAVAINAASHLRSCLYNLWKKTRRSFL